MTGVYFLVTVTVTTNVIKYSQSWKSNSSERKDTSLNRKKPYVSVQFMWGVGNYMRQYK